MMSGACFVHCSRRKHVVGVVDWGVGGACACCLVAFCIASGEIVRGKFLIDLALFPSSVLARYVAGVGSHTYSKSFPRRIHMVTRNSTSQFISSR